MPRLIMVFLSLLVASFGVSAAMAAPKVAVFPFDIHDIEMDGDYFAKPKDYDLARLKLIAEELKTLMLKDGTYEIVDLGALAADIEKASPFNKCDGCEVPIAKQAGADLAVTGFIDKVSDALISLQLFARDTATGELKKSMSAEIRGNTDELWLHGIRYLWKNRFNVQAAKQ